MKGRKKTPQARKVTDGSGASLLSGRTMANIECKRDPDWGLSVEKYPGRENFRRTNEIPNWSPNVTYRERRGGGGGGTFC